MFIRKLPLFYNYSLEVVCCIRSVYVCIYICMYVYMCVCMYVCLNAIIVCYICKIWIQRFISGMFNVSCNFPFKKLDHPPYCSPLYCSFSIVLSATFMHLVYPMILIHLLSQWLAVTPTLLFFSLVPCNLPFISVSSFQVNVINPLPLCNITTCPVASCKWIWQIKTATGQAEQDPNLPAQKVMFLAWSSQCNSPLFNRVAWQVEVLAGQVNFRGSLPCLASDVLKPMLHPVYRCFLYFTSL